MSTRKLKSNATPQVSANSQRSGVDFTTSGISAGLDYRFNRYFTAGFGIGYGRDSTGIGTNGTRSKAESYNAALYASLRPFKSFFIDGVAGYGAMRFNSQRFAVDDAALVYGTRNGSQVFGFEVDAFRKHSLLNGLDEIGITLQHAVEIKTFETKRRIEQPWLFS